MVGIKTINNTWFAQLYLGFSIKDKRGVNKFCNNIPNIMETAFITTQF